MDLEELTKTQLVLLAILISFVSAIVVGITIVTLMQQEPKPVTQTINRVIQQTIEKAVPGESKTQTIIVKEEDLIVDAIDKNSKNLVSIKTPAVDANTPVATLASGIAISADGLVVTDSHVIDEKGIYTITEGVDVYNADVVKIDPRGFAILRAKKDGGLKNFSFSILTDSSALKIGQSLIVLGGEQILSGIFTGFGEQKIPGTDEKAEPITYKTLKTSIAIPKSYIGSPIIDSNGKIAGFVTGTENAIIVIPASIIQEELPKAQ
ncbi:MAG: serine protease [Candidatus Paceibacterota bacterium]|jgi:hypothetical protein